MLHAEKLEVKGPGIYNYPLYVTSSIGKKIKITFTCMYIYMYIIHTTSCLLTKNFILEYYQDWSL